MSKKTTWIHDVPDAHFTNPACWTNGVPGDGDDVFVPPHPEGKGFEWPPNGDWPVTLRNLTTDVATLNSLRLPAFPAYFGGKAK